MIVCKGWNLAGLCLGISKVKISNDRLKVALGDHTGNVVNCSVAMRQAVRCGGYGGAISFPVLGWFALCVDVPAFGVCYKLWEVFQGVIGAHHFFAFVCHVFFFVWFNDSVQGMEPCWVGLGFGGCLAKDEVCGL